MQLNSITSRAYYTRLLNNGIHANQVVLGQIDQYYIGGSRINGEWIWVTQEPFSYQNWAAREPPGDGPALVSSGRQNWQWNDLPALDANSNGYILESSGTSLNLSEGQFNLLPINGFIPGLNQVRLEAQNATGQPIGERLYFSLAPD